MILHWTLNHLDFRVKVVTGLFVALLCSGCATIRNGGAPEPAFNYENDLKDLETLFAPAARIENLGTNPSLFARNNFIDGRITLYNIRYVRFVRDLGVDKQHMDAATDILLLAINLSSAATSAIRAKTNLALLASGITGGKITIDKHFYFDKTVPALIATMNAQRKNILVEILKGRAKSMADYSLTRALDDLSSYEQASTLIGAIAILQADAAEKEKVADEGIRTLEVPTLDQTAEKKRLGASLSSLRTDSPEHLKSINAILSARRGNTVALQSFTEALTALSAEFRNDPLENLPLWRKAILRAGVLIAD